MNPRILLESALALCIQPACGQGEATADQDAQREFPHALIPDLLADPSIIEVDGNFYCFATTGGMGQGLKTSGPPVVWKSRDFVNWSFAGTIYPPGFDAKYWTPSTPVKKDGRWYLFPTLDGRVTATVSKSLDGKTWKSAASHEEAKIQSPHTDVKIGPARYLKVAILQGNSRSLGVPRVLANRT